MSNIAGRYKQLENDRQPFLDRARQNAKLTLPSLIPEEGHSGSSAFVDPYQSVGARGVFGISAKATQTLLPPNEPFFRLDIDEHTLAELAQNPEARTAVEDALVAVERTVSRKIESSGIRAAYFEGVTHLVVGGNVLVFIDADLKMRIFGLNQYVVVRDPAGNVIEIITKETVARASLPEDVLQLVAKPEDKDVAPGAKSPPVKSDTVDLYTQIKREGELFQVIQAVDNMFIPGTEGSYPVDRCPWLPLRWTRVDGEAYGRSYVEGIAGDLKTLEALTKAVTDYAAAAAKVIPLVDPNGVTDEDDLAKAENFQFVSGREGDISFMKIDKYADLQVVKSLQDDLTRRIEQYFLMHSSIQRAGERVTAEEIRYMAADLEATVGAVYVQLSQEFQLPLVQITLHRMTKQKAIPALPKDTVTPTVTTGIDALSRQSDLSKLDRMVAGLRDLYGPETLATETNASDYTKRRANALGIDPKGFIKTPEQKKAEQDARMQEQMMMQTAPNMVNQMGNVMAKGAENG